MKCPTVRIKSDNEQGYVVINEADFDSSKHEWYVEDAPADEPPADEPPADEPPAEAPANKRGRK